jgi:hypothetical protein
MTNDPAAAALLRIEEAKAWLEKMRTLGAPEAVTLAEAFTTVNRMNLAMRVALGRMLPLLERHEMIHCAELKAILMPLGPILALSVVPGPEERGH